MRKMDRSVNKCYPEQNKIGYKSISEDRTHVVLNITIAESREGFKDYISSIIKCIQRF